MCATSHAAASWLPARFQRESLLPARCSPSNGPAPGSRLRTGRKLSGGERFANRFRFGDCERGPSMTLRIGVVTVARSDYGIYYPVLRLLQADPSFDLRLMVAAAHLDNKQGDTVQEIEKDGFAIAARIPMTLPADSREAVAVALQRNWDPGVRGCVSTDSTRSAAAARRSLRNVCGRHRGTAPSNSRRHSRRWS